MKVELLGIVGSTHVFTVEADTDDPNDIDVARCAARGIIEVVSERDRGGITCTDMPRGMEIRIHKDRRMALAMVKDAKAMIEQLKVKRN